MKLTDPWAKLAVAYAVNGRNDEATRYFTRALERAKGHEARKPILELAAHFGDLLPALIERQPDEPQLQLALARSLARRGKQHLAEKQPAQAQAELEKSREILARLRAKYPEPLWTVLKPTELKSERGQTLTLEGDGSIRASGTNPDRDNYCTQLEPEIVPRAAASRGGTVDPTSRDEAREVTLTRKAKTHPTGKKSPGVRLLRRMGMVSGHTYDAAKEVGQAFQPDSPGPPG